MATKQVAKFLALSCIWQGTVLQDDQKNGSYKTFQGLSLKILQCYSYHIVLVKAGNQIQGKARI
jgi:hypothetical protein